jgi:hypothetical protein
VCVCVCLQANRLTRKISNGTATSLKEKCFSNNHFDRRYVMMFEQDQVMLTCRKESPPSILSSLKDIGLDVNKGFKLRVPPKYLEYLNPPLKPGEIHCFGCSTNKTKLAFEGAGTGTVTIPRYAMIDDIDAQMVCSECFGKVQNGTMNENDEHELLVGSRVVSNLNDAQTVMQTKDSSISTAVAVNEPNPVSIISPRNAQSLLNAGTSSAFGFATKKSYDLMANAQKAGGIGAEFAKKQTTGKGFSTTLYDRWVQKMEPDTGYGVFDLKSIRYVVSRRTDEGDNMFQIDDAFTEFIEIIFVDKEDVIRIWHMKFQTFKDKIKFVRPLLEAKNSIADEDFTFKCLTKPPKPMHQVIFQKVKSTVKAAKNGMGDALFEKCFDSFSDSPWLKKVSIGTLDEIKQFVVDNIKNGQIRDGKVLAGRHEWSKNMFRHGALCYAAWFRQPLSVLRYLTDEIGIDVNECGVIGTALHAAVFKGYIEGAKFLVFKSHTCKHAPRKSILDSTMMAGLGGLDRWTPSDLLNNMWVFRLTNITTCTDDDLNRMTEFLDGEIDALEDWRDAQQTLSGSTEIGLDGKTKFERAFDEANAKLSSLLDITTDIREGVKSLTISAEKLSRQIEGSKNCLLRGLFAANEVTVPNCFIILPAKIESSLDTDESTDAKSSGGSIGLQSNSVAVKKRLDWMEKCVSMAVSDDIVATARLIMKSIIVSDTYYLYLVDEITQKPVIPIGHDAESVYPIEIEKPAEYLTNLLPMMSLTLKAISLYNNASSLAKLFGIPAPMIPQGMKDSLNKLKKNVTQGSSVSGDAIKVAFDLGVLESGKSQDGRSIKVKGHALREFENTLRLKDPNRTYCGLTRVLSTTGEIVFALAESIEANKEQFSGYEQQASLEREKKSLQLALDRMEAQQQYTGSTMIVPYSSSVHEAAPNKHELAHHSLLNSRGASKDITGRGEIIPSLTSREASMSSSIEPPPPPPMGFGIVSKKPPPTQTSVVVDPREALVRSNYNYQQYQANMHGVGLVGRRILLEGEGNKVARVIRYQKMGVMVAGHSTHYVRFEGDDHDETSNTTEVPVVLFRAKKGGYIGTRYIIVD